MAAASSRSRNITRKFILLRCVDPLRVPSVRNIEALERSGRVKEIIFSNNATTAAITELLPHAFGQHLTAGDISSLYFYKPVGSTTLLAEVCSGREVCGPTLKLHFKNGKKIYMRQTIAAGDQNDQRDEQDESEEGNDSQGIVRGNRGRDQMEEQGNQLHANSSHGNRDQGNSGFDYEALAVPGPSGETGTTRNLERPISTVYVSDEDDELLPPLHSTPRPSQHYPDTNSQAASGLTRRIYDNIVRVPTMVRSSTELLSWEENAREVGDIRDEPNLLCGAELDCESGAAYDVRIFEQLLNVNQVVQQLHVLCLPPLQVRLQSHFDSVPDCIIRYRPTKEAAELLRNLMSECGSLNQCHIHVALMGSPYDSEVCGMKCTGTEEHHIEIRVLQPTMSSTRMVVGDILSGNDPAFLANVRRAVEEALLRAVRSQRDLLLKDRDLRETQDREALASEMEDKRKGQANPQTTETTIEEATSEETTIPCECLEETVVDAEEVRQKRRRFLEKYQRENDGKRQRTDNGHGVDDDGEGNDSGIITFNIPEDNSPR